MGCDKQPIANTIYFTKLITEELFNVTHARILTTSILLRHLIRMCVRFNTKLEFVYVSYRGHHFRILRLKGIY